MDGFSKEEFPTWAKDGDVIVAVGVKSGTNWLLYISHLIRVKGDLEKYPFLEITCTTPWISLRHTPGQTWKDLKDKMNTTILPDGSKLKDHWDHPDYPFRVFKSHETPDDTSDKKPDAVLPVRSHTKVKFLAAVRTPEDQLRSIYPFFGAHSARFRRMWGDFPPVYKGTEETEEERRGTRREDIRAEKG